MYLRRMARMPLTPVSLEMLFRFGRLGSRDMGQRLRNAQFLHQELQVRIAQRVVELETLPLGLAGTSPITGLKGWYEDYFFRLSESKFPETAEDEAEFTDLLRFILQDQSAVIETIARGVLEIRYDMQGFGVEEQKMVDNVLNRFFLSRIGLRFLIEHHITSQTERQGFSGIIEGDCEILRYVELASHEAGVLCDHYYGESPVLSVEQVTNRDSVRFTYVPGHLKYMLTEVLKNSFKATVEFNRKKDEELPPVLVTIVEGETDVSIKISDRGGGIERAKAPLCWSYLHSTAEDPRVQEDLLHDGVAQSHVLAGYGVGLPLSRLYARYFGGDLDLKSMHGYGTDAFFHLPRLGENCENLPKTVLNSPAEGTSSIKRGSSQVFFFGNRGSWQENVELGQSEAFQPVEPIVNKEKK